MEYALYEARDGSRTLVWIKNAKAVLKERPGARFYCPNPKCGKEIIAVFPALTKKFREKAPSDYFRVKASHVDHCTKDGLTTFEEQAKARQAGMKAPAGTEFSTRGPAPVVLRRPIIQTGSVGVNPSRAADQRKGLIVKGGDRPSSFNYNQALNRTSKPGSYVLAKFVELFEDPSVNNREAPMSLYGGAERTVYDLFQPVANAFDTNGQPKASCRVYFGSFSRFETWKTGYSIYYQSRAAGRLVSVWVPFNNQPQPMLKSLKETLQAAIPIRSVVYSVGSFIFTHGKWSNEIESVHEVHISV